MFQLFCWLSVAVLDGTKCKDQSVKTWKLQHSQPNQPTLIMACDHDQYGQKAEFKTTHTKKKHPTI